MQQMCIFSTWISVLAAILFVSCTKTLLVNTRSVFPGDCLHTVIRKAFRAQHGRKLLSHQMLFVDCRSS